MEIEDQEKEIRLCREPYIIGGGAVDSVNGYTGDVILTTSDLENTSDYQTGDEVSASIAQALAGKEQIRILTEDDYSEFPSGVFSVLLWLLDDGIYYAPTGINISMSRARGFNGENSLILIKKDLSFTRVTRLGGSSFSSATNEIYNGIIQTDTALNHPNLTDGTEIYVYDALTSASLVQDLTTDSALRPLAAGQGRVLKNLIDSLVIKNQGAPTTATVGTVGMLLEDTTNGELYICTDVTGGVYTWEKVGGSSITPVQTTGTSTTDVMSQDATTKLVYPDIANNPYQMVIGEGEIKGTNKGLVINGVINTGVNSGSIAIGGTDGAGAQIGTQGRADQSIAIGNSASIGRGISSIAIGSGAYSDSGQNTGDNIAIGNSAYAGDRAVTSSVALGSYAKTTRAGEVNIGTGTNGTGYNSTNYRVIGGVHDGQNAHDAATVGQLDNRVKQNAGAPTTATEGTIGQLLEDTTNGKLYQCTAIDTTDPNNPSYTWAEVGAGGGGGDTVYSDKTTSNSRDGGAIYIGDKNATQDVANDPTATDNHYRYFWAMPYNSSIDATTVIPGDETINIGGVQGQRINEMGGGTHNVNIGYRSKTGTWADGQTVIGWQAQSSNSYATAYGANSNAYAQWSTAIGYDAQCWQQGSVALGKGAYPTRQGEVNIGADSVAAGYNNTNYRVIGGVHDPVDAHDAATKGYVDAHAGGGVTTFYISPSDYNDITAGQTTITLYKESALTNSVNGGEIYDALMGGAVRFATVDTQSSFQRYHNVFTFDLPLANTDAEWSSHGTVNIEAGGMSGAPFTRLMIDISGRTSSTITGFLGE